LIIATQANTPIIHKEYEDVLRSLAVEIPLSEIHAQLARLEDGFDQLDKNANTRLLTEVMIMGLPQRRKSQNPPH
jgi:hypothetical protein